jgi:hypothetical protein
MSKRMYLASLTFTLVMSACQLTSAAVPAVLTRADDQTMTRLRVTLAQAMGRSQVELGPGDPTQTSTLSVLPLPPGPLEDRSLAKPTIFRLEIAGVTCALVREGTSERIALEGIDCRAAAR